MNTRRPLRLAPALTALALGAMACTDSVSGGASPDTTDLDSEQILLTSELETFDSCDGLLERIKDEAVERVGPYGFDQGGQMIFTDDVMMAEDSVLADGVAGSAGDDMAASLPAADAGGADEAGRSSADSKVSGTNNQEQGVDEADLVKTDGNRLVVVSGNTLRVIDTTGDVPELTKTVKLPDDAYGGQLFLAGDQALLMTSGWTDMPFIEGDGDRAWFPGSATARLISIDLSDGTIKRTIDFEGAYLSAREIDGSVRIVLSASASRFAFVYPSNDGATEASEAANRSLIENSTIDQWLPTYRVTEGDNATVEGQVVDCENVHIPAEFAGFGSLVMLTADAENGFEINDAVSVFTDAQTIYASTDRVAVATPRWPTWGANGEIVEDDVSYATAVHTFDITDPATARYVASGSVRGHLLNQYSLSEYDGHLRVATTDGNPWGAMDGGSESFVTVLDEDGQVLRQVGQVGGLGKGEQIQAVRFLGNRGYVVTFRQVDPLYTLDLSDPTNPTVEGELKIPGFSSYLHPVDDDHVLGVGTDGDDSGATFGAAVSLFDVSDPSTPTLMAKLAFDQLAERTNGSSHTPVSGDAKAFTYWDDTAIIPISWWNVDERTGREENGSEAVLVAVDTAGNLTWVGSVSHPVTEECEDGVIYDDPIPVEPDGGDGSGTVGTQPPTDSDDAEASFVDKPDEDQPTTTEIAPGFNPELCYRSAPQISRSVIIDGELFTVSEAGVKVNQFDGLADVTWIPFGRS